MRSKSQVKSIDQALCNSSYYYKAFATNAINVDLLPTLYFAHASFALYQLSNGKWDRLCTFTLCTYHFASYYCKTQFAARWIWIQRLARSVGNTSTRGRRRWKDNVWHLWRPCTKLWTSSTSGRSASRRFATYLHGFF